jgi:hypothetical protein
MNEYLISMFIDDELDIDEKIAFVEKVHADKAYKNESVELLVQEKFLRSEVVDHIPPMVLEKKKRNVLSFLRPAGFMASAAAVVMLIFFLLLPAPEKATKYHRFVIYRPDITEAYIAGTFTEWESMPLKSVGSTGYWETTLNLPYGEHRFTYIIDGNRRYADPTVVAQENDDFGGKNSILFVGSET